MAYQVFADIASTAAWSPNLSSSRLLLGLQDGSFQLDYAEQGEDAVSIAAAAMISMSRGHTNNQNVDGDGVPARDHMDRLLAYIFTRPKANPWQFEENHGEVLTNLLRKQLPLALDAALSHPACPGSRVIEQEQRDRRITGHRQSKSSSPLHVAVSENDSAVIVDILAKHGFDLNGLDAQGNRPIAYAHSQETVEALVRNGASPWFADDAGTPTAAAWSREGVPASTIPELTRVLRATAAKHAKVDPSEAYALARGATGLRAIQDAMTRHGLGWHSPDPAGLNVADHVMLGLLVAPSRAASESARQEGLLRAVEKAITAKPDLFPEQTHERLALANLRFSSASSPCADTGSILSRLDADVEAGILRPGSQVAASLMLALPPKHELCWAMADRMSRLCEDGSPWAMPPIPPQSDEDVSSIASRRLLNAIKRWTDHASLSSIAIRFAKMSEDPAMSPQQATLGMHAMLPWTSKSAFSRYTSVFTTDVNGMYVELPMQQAFSRLMSAGGYVDGSLPGFADRALAAMSGYATYSISPPPKLVAALEHASLQAMTAPLAPAQAPRGMRL
jgi:hypothetical protein